MRRITWLAGLVLVAALAAAPRPAGATAPAPPTCDAPLYAGLRHCVHTLGASIVHVLIVDLTDPAVSLRLALPARETPQGWLECSSTDQCGGGPYPFETVPHMLSRHLAGGAVGGINTDYFGLSYRPDHGAEGVAVRDGRRLDDGHSSDLVGRTGLAISQDNRASLLWVGSRDTPLDLAGRHFTVAGGGPQVVSAGRPLDNQACLAERLPVAACARQYHSAAGLRDGGRTLILAVARNMDAAGLAAFLAAEYRVAEALKFDGGGSAQLAWLDATGQVAGFDASGETDGGFRRVAEGLLVFSTLLPAPVSDQFPGLALDDSGPAFRTTGYAEGWHTALGGRSQQAAFKWTRNNTWMDSRAGEWALSPGAPGRYGVYAYIPIGHATTRSARYEVHGKFGVAVVAVDQWTNRGNWVYLGEFDLSGDGQEYVRLGNATGEAQASRLVAYDAIGLVLAGSLAP